MYPTVFVVLILAVSSIIQACPSIIPRATWGARSPKRTTYIGGNLPYVIIHETGGPQCPYPEQACGNMVKSIQDYHMNSENSAHDIDYNFLVDQFGNIYEGRGWDYKANYEMNYELNSIGIALIGSYRNTIPSANAIKAFKELIACGVRFQKLKYDFKILADRQIKNNDCPGIKFYELIKTWPHWTNMT